MSPLILAATIGQLALATEPARNPDHPECAICLVTYVVNPQYPEGRQFIHEECDYTSADMTKVRARQLQIATEGNTSYLSLEDWGTWYGPHRIESVVLVPQPPCQ